MKKLKHREMVLVAGVRYHASLVANKTNQYKDLLIPTEANHNSKGSHTAVPYGCGVDGLFNVRELEEELHAMMRDGSLAIPYNYSSRIMLWM